MAGNVYRIGDKGERVVLSDRERERAIERARRAVTEWCD
jgi:dihydrodipicolinate synthase/N-acetylneuraminate lyase